MTSYQFEKAAKNAVVNVMKEKHGIAVGMDELQLVWFAHTLGHKKCTLYAHVLGNYYPEVTYSLEKHELYVDVYEKVSNTRIKGSYMDFEAHVGRKVNFVERKEEIEAQ